MADVVTPPKQSEFSKLSADMLQYVFDLERAVESRFHWTTIGSSLLVGAFLGFIVGHVI